MRSLPRWLIALAVLAVAVAVGAYLLSRRNPAPPAVAPPPPPTIAAPTPSPAPSIEEAFAIVYPQPTQAVSWRGQSQDVRFSPVSLHKLDADTFALISAGRSELDCHSCGGFYSVAYLTGYPLLKVAAPPFIGSASAGGFGAPPKIAVASGLAARPTLVVSAGFGAQGMVEEWASLVRLGERPTVVAERVPLGYDNRDAGGGCSIQGRIEPGGKDRDFAVVYSGAMTRSVTWTWTGRDWRSSEPGLKLPQACPR